MGNSSPKPDLIGKFPQREIPQEKPTLPTQPFT